MAQAPQLEDYQEVDSLILAIDQSLRYYEKLDPESAIQFSKQWVKLAAIKESLIDFKVNLQELGLSDAFYRYIEEDLLLQSNLHA